MATTKKVAPEGGWGWMVVIGTALSNLCILPIMFSIGLIFREIFDDYGLSHKDASIILNVNSAIGMLTGMINGALLKYFGCRKVAVLAGFLLTSGVILTAFARTFWEFTLYYGTIAAFGMGMSRSAFNLAISSYFVEKRGRAISIAMTITGIGPIIMPQLISFMMENATAQSAILIIGAISGNSIVAAVMLQPVEWHMKTVESEEEELVDIKGNKSKMFAIPEDDEEDLEEITNVQVLNNKGQTPEERPQMRREKSFLDTILSVDEDIDAGALYGFDTPLAKSLMSLDAESKPSTINKSQSASVLYNRKPETIIRNSSYAKGRVYDSAKDIQEQLEEVKKKSIFKRLLEGIVNIFDLSLLKDPVYVNIMIGMSLAIFAEMNFSILTPFIFAEFGLSLSQNATALSTLAISDLIFRFLAPYISEILKQPARIMYMLALGLLCLIRFGLLFSETYIHVMIIAVAIGMTRGVRIIYRNLLIPSHVPINLLASANGMQMVVNGIFIMLGGPILGIVRDQTGNYDLCIVIINVVTLLCILSWSIEMVYLRIKKKKALGR